MDAVVQEFSTRNPKFGDDFFLLLFLVLFCKLRFQERISKSVRKIPPLSGVCASLPLARPPPSRRSPMPTCSATPAPQVGSPACKTECDANGLSKYFFFVLLFCLFVFFCRSFVTFFFAYILFQCSDLLLCLHQFEFQVTHLPV